MLIFVLSSFTNWVLFSFFFQCFFFFFFYTFISGDKNFTGLWESDTVSGDMATIWIFGVMMNMRSWMDDKDDIFVCTFGIDIFYNSWYRLWKIILSSSYVHVYHSKNRAQVLRLIWIHHRLRCS